MCCSVLEGVAVWCSVVRCGAAWCSVLQCVTACCSVLQCAVRCGAAWWSVVQWVVVCCCVAVRYSALQCIAVCCSAQPKACFHLIAFLRMMYSKKKNRREGKKILQNMNNLDLCLHFLWIVRWSCTQKYIKPKHIYTYIFIGIYVHTYT